MPEHVPGLAARIALPPQIVPMLPLQAAAGGTDNIAGVSVQSLVA
jgi:hypothetical protein